MTIKYGDYNFVFDYVKFRNDLVAFHDAHKLAWTDIDALAGMSVGYCNGVATEKNRNHKIENILALCNVMDINPQDYFILDV